MIISTVTISGTTLSLGYSDLSADRVPHTDNTPRARGEIKGISRRARNHLTREINRLPTSPTCFVVLNFPPGVPIDPLFVRTTIKLLGQRLVRRFPDSATLWRLEFNKKSVPHIHMMGNFDSESEHVLTDWLFTAWCELLSYSASDPDNIVYVYIPFDFERPQKVRYFCKNKDNDNLGAMRYCKIYGSTGRCSGHFNRAKANMAPIERHLGNEIQRKKIETILVDSLKQRLAEIKPGVNVPARQAFIERVASGKDTCLHFQSPELIEKVRTILGDAA